MYDVEKKFRTITSYADFCKGNGYPAYPMELFLEVSNVCNLKCAMCWQFSALNRNRFKQLQAQGRGFLNKSEIDENLKSVLDGALLVHCFGFGEPTVHPDFKSIIELVTSHGAMSDFYTNGMSLDQSLCEFLVDMGVIQVVISFSGTSKAFYESVYIGSDFEHVLSGVKRLADTKKARGSRYPVIYIGSIGFKDHVATFDDCVLMMSRQGADVVRLGHLSVHSDMPYLAEHVSNMRAEEEVVLARAKKVGAALGVRVDASGYEHHKVSNQADYEARQAALRLSVEPILAAEGRTYGRNPVNAFRDIAHEIPIARETELVRLKPINTVPLDASSDVVNATLEIKPYGSKDPERRFYCMEPYKTMYVTRNGSVKACCEAPIDVMLGQLDSQKAVEIWNSPGYKGVRDGIANGKYPEFCVACLTNRSAPEYYVPSLVDNYVVWNSIRFGNKLAERLSETAPDAQTTIRETPHTTLMSFVRARTK